MSGIYNRIIKGKEYTLYLNGDVYKDGKYQYAIFELATLKNLLDQSYSSKKQKLELDKFLKEYPTKV